MYLGVFRVHVLLVLVQQKVSELFKVWPQTLDKNIPLIVAWRCDVFCIHHQITSIRFVLRSFSAGLTFQCGNIL